MKKEYIPLITDEAAIKYLKDLEVPFDKIIRNEYYFETKELILWEINNTILAMRKFLYDNPCFNGVKNGYGEMIKIIASTDEKHKLRLLFNQAELIIEEVESEIKIINDNKDIREKLKEDSIKILTGIQIAMTKLKELLNEMSFRRVDTPQDI